MIQKEGLNFLYTKNEQKKVSIKYSKPINNRRIRIGSQQH